MSELSFDIIARRKWFQKPSALRLAVDQLEDAQRDLLEAEYLQEHYYGVVDTLRVRISRLKDRVNTLRVES